VINRIHQL